MWCNALPAGSGVPPPILCIIEAQDPADHVLDAFPCEVDDNQGCVKGLPKGGEECSCELLWCRRTHQLLSPVLEANDEFGYHLRGFLCDRVELTHQFQLGNSPRS